MQNINHNLSQVNSTILPLRNEETNAEVDKIVQMFQTIINSENELLLYFNNEDHKKYLAYQSQGCSSKWAHEQKAKLVAGKVIQQAIIGQPIETILYSLRNTANTEEFLHFLKVKPEILEEIQSTPNVFATDIWERYVVKVTNFNRHYNNADQTVYGNMMHRSVAIAAKLLKKKTCSTAEIREFLADRRRDIAFFQLCNTPLCTQRNIKRANHYGFVRPTIEGAATTKLRERTEYHSIVEETWRYIKKCKLEGKDHLLEAEIDEENEKPNGYVTFFSTINGEKVMLHNIDFDFSYELTSFSEEKQDEVTETQYCPIFYHTQRLGNPDYDKILKYLDCLFEEALQELNPKLLLITLAKIFFWSCHSKIYFFGELSIAETEFRSIWESKEFNCLKSLPPWKNGVIPWKEVVTRFIEEDFVKVFPSFFDWDSCSLDSNMSGYDLFEL